MSGTPPIVLDYPLAGRWMVVNSPGRRVPSHGTHRFGLSHAIDLVPVAFRRPDRSGMHLPAEREIVPA